MKKGEIIWDSLTQSFDQIAMSGPDWPVHVQAQAAGEAAFRRWPNFPKAATPQSERMGYGRGVDVSAAAIGATAELVEIASCCEWGDEEKLLASSIDLGTDAWVPHRINGFSDLQIEHRNGWNARLQGLDRIPCASHPDEPIEWVNAKSLISGNSIAVPADSVFIGRCYTGKDEAVSVADTNGCATGETVEAAMLSALLELIERDATGMWWYRRRVCKHISHALTKFGRDIHQFITSRARRLFLIDITTDLGIPVIAALSCDPDEGRIAVGFAAGLSLPAAMDSALRELMQMELVVEATAIHSELSELHMDWYRYRLEDIAPFVMMGPEDESVGSFIGAAGLPDILTRFADRKCDVAMINATRPEFGVPVVRVIAPELCHWKPRFGRARLLRPENSDSRYSNSLNDVFLRM